MPAAAQFGGHGPQGADEVVVGLKQRAVEVEFGDALGAVGGGGQRLQLGQPGIFLFLTRLQAEHAHDPVLPFIQAELRAYAYGLAGSKGRFG